MFTNQWLTAGALLVGIVAIIVGIRLIVTFVINKESGPGGLPPGSTD